MLLLHDDSPVQLLDPLVTGRRFLACHEVTLFLLLSKSRARPTSTFGCEIYVSENAPPRRCRSRKTYPVLPTEPNISDNTGSNMFTEMDNLSVRMFCGFPVACRTNHRNERGLHGIEGSLFTNISTLRIQSHRGAHFAPAGYPPWQLAAVLT